MRGFFITIHGVDGLASGLHQCIVIQLNQSLGTTHYKVSLTLQDVFYSDIKDEISALQLISNVYLIGIAAFLSEHKCQMFFFLFLFGNMTHGSFYLTSIFHHYSVNLDVYDIIDFKSLMDIPCVL